MGKIFEQTLHQICVDSEQAHEKIDNVITQL